MGSYSCCTDSKLTKTQFATLSQTLKVVADESRLQILCLLCQSEHCVSEIVPHFAMSQSLVSHHLRDLKDAELVSCRKDGLKVYYSLTSDGRLVVQNLFKIPSLISK